MQVSFDRDGRCRSLIGRHPVRSSLSVGIEAASDIRARTRPVADGADR
jgi:hypothetical protein